MIRPFREEDYNNLVSLGKLYNDNFENLYINAKDDILVSIEDNEINGFLITEKSIDEVSIILIYVKEKYRSNGIASSLLDYLLSNIDDSIKRIILEVKDDNYPALALYKKYDFNKVGTRKQYYKDLKDAIIMERMIKMNDVKILAIESSCDETSIAIVKNGKEVLSLKTNTQISTHEKYGGVVPEVASRMHCENITIVLNEVLEESKIKMEDIDAIAVTYGPGLLGSLLVGVNFAKTLSAIYNKPLIAVNHLIGHIYANNIESNLEFPLLTLIVSGGHTELLYMDKDYSFKLLGQTLDDAIGESYDKVAKVLGEKYPGGPNIEKLAKLGTNDIGFSVPVNDDTYNFSYSGLKSNVLNYVNNRKMKGEDINKEDIAYSFQKTAVKELTNKVTKALNEYKVNDLVVAGGVSANNYLKEELQELCNKYNVNLKIPSLIYCTDNAAMIGAAAYPKFLNKEFVDLDLDAVSSLNIC